MRTIKFRGKDIKTGEWVQGYFVGITNNEAAIIPFNKVDYDVGYIGDSECSYCNIETVGQFTDFLDKNRKEIYEGDMIRSYDSENNPIIHIISWDNKKACYVATMLQYPLLGGSIDQGWIDEFEKEVIGNIFDNPELLEGE